MANCTKEIVLLVIDTYKLKGEKTADNLLLHCTTMVLCKFLFSLDTLVGWNVDVISLGLEIVECYRLEPSVSRNYGNIWSSGLVYTGVKVLYLYGGGCKEDRSRRLDQGKRKSLQPG